MKNKKLLIGGASALSIATLSLGAFAFFSDSVELTKNTKVGSVDLSASAEIKHTQLKRNRANSDIIYGSELYDDIVGPEEITYPYYPESIDNARYPASWDIDFIENIQQTMDAFEEAPDNINPGDNYNYGDYNFYPGTDHELIVNIENTGTKSIQTRILFEISGTDAEGNPLTTSQLEHFKLFYDAMNSVSGLTSVSNNLMLPPEIYDFRKELLTISNPEAAENSLTYAFDEYFVHDVIDRTQTHFGSVMTLPHSDAAFTNLVLSGTGENAETEMGLKRYYVETKNETEYSWDYDWVWDIETEEILAPTSASFKFDIAMDSGLEISRNGNIVLTDDYEEIQALAGANLEIKVIVQGLQYRNTNDDVWEDLFTQVFRIPN